MSLEGNSIGSRHAFHTLQPQESGDSAQDQQCAGPLGKRQSFA